MSSSVDDISTCSACGGRKSVITLALASTLLISGCSETTNFNIKDIFQPKAESGEEVVARANPDTTLIERDVEAPDVFKETEDGLWDGRPSLGGIWVAHPDVTEPERVRIRNASNGKFIEGALFRRERETPGPTFQVSSEAASSLGMLAGAPTQIEVVALRKEAVPVADPTTGLPVGAGALADESVLEDESTLESAPEVQTASLDPLAGAAAAIDAAVIDTNSAQPPVEASMAAEELLFNEAAIITEEKATSTPSEALEKPYVQIGIFSQEQNAERTADVLRGIGMVPSMRNYERNGKEYWRLLVGPANSQKERSRVLAQIKKQGFSDAYPVTN